jgi:protein-disulfide isomerase
MTDETPLETSSENQNVTSEKRTGNGEITITFRRWHLYAIIMPLVFGLGLGIGYLVWGRLPASAASETVAQAPSEPAAAQASPQASPETTQQIVRYDVPVDDDPSIGPDDAPITIVEFSDYECPYCRSWHNDVFARLQDEYPQQVRLVYRDFPLSSIHANAVPAAVAANCANEQDKFWPFHDNLFSMELGLSDEAYQEYASRLGMNVQAFLECMESDRYQTEVQADYQFASDLGVRSTPTFFINGIAVVGAQPFDVFKQVIDKELAGEIP